MNEIQRGGGAYVEEDDVDLDATGKSNGKSVVIDDNANVHEIAIDSLSNMLKKGSNYLGGASDSDATTAAYGSGAASSGTDADGKQRG